MSDVNLSPLSPELRRAATTGNAERLCRILEAYPEEERLNVLNSPDQKGITLLMLAAEQGDDACIKVILEAYPTIEQRIQALSTVDSEGYTALMVALVNSNTKTIKCIIESYPTTEQKVQALSRVDDSGCTILRLAAAGGRASVIQAILEACPEKERLNVLNLSDQEGRTALTLAAGYEEIHPLKMIMRFVPLVQQTVFFEAVNNQGERAITMAENENRIETVNFLRELLPILNKDQSTHNAIVHDYVARSAVNLVERYIQGLSREEKNDLKAWTTGKPAAPEEQKRHEKVCVIMAKLEQDSRLLYFIQEHEPAISEWKASLTGTHQQLAASRAIDRIYTEHTYKEPQSNVSLPLALSLVWCALNQSYFTREEQKTRHDALITHLAQTSREYNLNDVGQDEHPSDPDNPACVGGLFNNLLQTLSGGLHPDEHIEPVFVNAQSVRLKANALAASLFDLKKYTSSEIKKLKNNFIEEVTYELPKSVLRKLKIKVLEALKIEFKEFVEANFIEVAEVSSAAEKALDSLTPDSAIKIIAKLNEHTELLLNLKKEKDKSKEKAGVSQPLEGDVIAKRTRSQRAILFNHIHEQKPSEGPIASRTRGALKRKI